MTAVKVKVGEEADFEIQRWWIAGCLTVQGMQDYIDFSFLCVYICLCEWVW